MGGEDADKIIRIPGETLIIKVTPEEVKYRNKYLPDPKKLTDEKLVCTVCSVSLAQNVHRGKQIFIHRCLQVLVCEACFNFYGDGCFSADEDGDDKYCRWCGQGGTLYLCSTCTCGFCQKCVKLNLKASVLADLDNDDWKCYICNPRPLFGSRAICWGAEELNKIGKEKEQEKLKKQKEKLEKLEEKKKEEMGRKSRKHSSSEDEAISKKRKSRANDGDSSSPEVMPAKRLKRISLETRNLNGSLNISRKTRKDSSSDDESSEEDKRLPRRSRGKNKKNKKVAADSSSEDDSDNKSRRKSKSKKKRAKNSSDESSDEDYKITKRRSIKKTADSSDDESTDEKHSKKKKKSSKKKKEVKSDVSSDEKKKKVKRNKEDSSEASSDDNKKKSRKHTKKKAESSDSESDNRAKKERKSFKSRKSIDDKKKNDVNSDGGEEIKRKRNDDDETTDDKSEEIKLKESCATVDNLVKKRIKLAILWLDTAVKDIAELGSLISLRATKFAKKKINSEHLKSYEDVLSTVSKLKQLMSGIHSNYDHIEKNLDAQLKPWKILTGVEESETEKPVEEETRLSADGRVPECQNISGDSHDSKNTEKEVTNNNSPTNVANIALDIQMAKETCDEKVKTETAAESNNLDLKWDNLSVDEDSDNDNQKVTEAITKASETLDKLDEVEDMETNKSNNHDDSKTSEISKDDINKKRDDTTIDDLDEKSVSNILDNSSKDSQSESDEKNSDVDKTKSKKSGYKSLLGSSKSDYKTQDAKDKNEKEDVSKKLKSTKTEEVHSDSEMSEKL